MDTEAVNPAVQREAGEALAAENLRAELARLSSHAESLKQASREELLHELGTRNLATLVFMDCIVEVAPGEYEGRSRVWTCGPLTQIHGMLSIHGSKLFDRIEEVVGGSEASP